MKRLHSPGGKAHLEMRGVKHARVGENRDHGKTPGKPWPWQDLPRNPGAQADGVPLACTDIHRQGTPIFDRVGERGAQANEKSKGGWRLHRRVHRHTRAGPLGLSDTGGLLAPPVGRSRRRRPRNRSGCTQAGPNPAKGGETKGQKNDKDKHDDARARGEG